MWTEMLKARDRGQSPELVATNHISAADEPRKVIGAERHAERQKPAVPPRQRAEGKPAEEASVSVADLLAQAWLLLRRQWLLLAMGVMLGAALVPIAFVVLPPPYKSTATLMLDASRMQLFPQQNVLGDTPFDNAAAIESQLEVIRSDRIARKVIEALKLDQDPTFEVARETRTARILGPTLADILGRPVLRTPERIERVMIDRLTSMIEVRRVSGTFAVEIIASSENATRAAEIANAVAAAYLSENIEHKQDLGSRAIGWMSGRIEAVRDQLDGAQKAVTSYRAANSLDGINEERFNDTRIKDLERQLGSAKAAALDARARLDRMTQAIESRDVVDTRPVVPGPPTDASADKQLARYLEIHLSNSAATEKLRETYFDLQTRLNDWTKRFGKQHEVIERLSAQLQSVRDALHRDYLRLADGYRGEYEVAQKRAEAIEQELTAALEEKARVENVRLRLKELEGAVQIQQRTLDSLVSRQAETHEQRSFPIARAWVLDKATEPVKRVLKRTLLAGGLLFGFGVVLGLGGAALREFGDRSFRRFSDLRGVFPSATVEAVPNVREPRKESPASPGGHLQAGKPETNRRPLARSQGVFWRVLDDPGSVYARSIRSIRYDLERVIGKPGANVIGITGAGPGAGASSTAAAVALATASAGVRTLLVDCNMSDAGLTRELAPGATEGLVEVVQKSVTLGDAVWADPKTGLHFLPAVLTPAVVCDQVIASTSLAELVGSWRSDYDVIIVDLPHLAHPIEVGLSRNFISSYIAVAQWGHSGIDTVRESIQHHSLDAKTFSVVVLNRVKVKGIKSYDPEAFRWIAG